MELLLLRERRRMTQDDVAEAAGLSRSGYNLYERGVRGMPLNVFFRIAEILGTDPVKVIDTAKEHSPKAFRLVTAKQLPSR